MKLYYSPYVLKKKIKFGDCDSAFSSGILLKVEWPEGIIGYSDLHPLKFLGDVDIVEELERLRSGKLSFHAEQSIWLARRDGEARKSKKSLLEGVHQLKNNYLIVNSKDFDPLEIKNISEKGYQTVKLKMSQNFEDDRQLMSLIVKEGLQIRLDANSNSNFMQFLKLSSSLDKLIRNRIEYVEDPFKYKMQQWQQAQAYLNLAVDFEKQNVDWPKLKGLNSKERPFSHLILKPAREDVDKSIHQAVENGIKVTITSSMDHFVGALHALSLSATLRSQYGELIQEPGCLTFNLYHPEPFSKAVINEGPQLFLNEEAKGFGIGFDRLFSELPWESI